MKSITEIGSFAVEITVEGSKRAHPAIWYAGKHGKNFIVKKSKEWTSVYEVAKGYFKGKLIDPKDCRKITSQIQ